MQRRVLQLILAVSALMLVHPSMSVAQSVAPDSQAIAAAIVRSIIPALRANTQYSGRVLIENGPLVGSVRVVADTSAPWRKLLRAQMRSQAPDLHSDSASRFLMTVRIATVELLGQTAIVRGAYSRCVGSTLSNLWVYFFEIVLSVRDSQWQGGPVAPKGHADGSCLRTSLRRPQ